MERLGVVDRTARPRSAAPGGAVARVAALFVAIASLAATDCKTAEGCDPGEACVCSGGSDCFLGCTGDGCSQDCHSVGDTCGTVCGNGCSSLCHDVSTCTSSCGSDCNLTCHSVSSCGAICGDNCDYSCESASTCGVQAGSGSTIRCTSVSTCEADCTGTCHVACTNVSTCAVHCLGGGAPISCPDGTLACGPC